ncbi:MAG: hypothetical protein WDO69_31110 [Pseudomonadota bacterium]
MLAATTRQGIVRVEVFDSSDPNQPKSRGTGFLVTAASVLTAAHVLAVANPTKIEVYFENSPPILATVHPVSQGAKADWVLLNCQSVPGTITPVPLERLLLHPYDVRWETFGWPWLYRQLGGYVRGEVRYAGQSEIDSTAYELEEQPSKEAEGISGAPCVVHGAAIGLVIEVVQVAGKAVAGTLKVLPAQTITDESKGALQLRNDTPLPYLDYFRTLLEQLPSVALTSLAKILAIEGAEGVAGIPRDEAAHQVARAMIMGGVPATVAVVRKLKGALDPAAAKELLRLAETLWIDEAAAKQLARIADRTPPRPFAINARHQDIGLDYVHRASYAHEPMLFPTWPERHVVVPQPRQEPFSTSLFDAVVAELKNKYSWPTDKKMLAALRADGPFTALIVGSTPTQQALAEIGQKLAPLHVLVLSHPSRRAELAALAPDARYIEPELGEMDEDYANDARSSVALLRTERGW